MAVGDNYTPAVYERKAEIDITPSEAVPSWRDLNFMNLSPSANEVTEDNQFASGKGFANHEVYGSSAVYAFTDKRRPGDEVQDYVMGLKTQFGKARHTRFRLTDYDGSQLVWDGAVNGNDATLQNIEDGGGDAVASNDISFEIAPNGKPTVVPGPNTLGALTVVSVAGATSGQTMIYVNPSKGAGNSYKYKTSTSVALPSAGDILTTGWTAWDGSAAITATTGNQIVIVEVVTATNAAVNAGIATVTAKA